MAKTASEQPKSHKRIYNKERAIALYTQGFGVGEISKKLGFAKSTVSGWIKRYKSENPDNEIEQIRTDRLKNFAEKAWDILDDSMTLAARRVSTAKEREAEFDRMIEEVAKDKSMPAAKRSALIAKLQTLQVHSIRDISTLINTLYDKQALANGETTQNIGGLDFTLKVVE